MRKTAKTAKTRRRATKPATTKKKTSGRGSVKSAARKAGARTAGKVTAGKKKTAARPQPASRRPALMRPDVIGATREVSPSRATLSTPAVAAVPGTCLSLDDAAAIVLKAAGNPSGGLDVTLEDAHLISTLLRQRFQQRVFDAVRAKGCALDLAAIPNDADTTLGEVADVVQAQAR